jgi:hypothetical protein
MMQHMLHDHIRRRSTSVITIQYRSTSGGIRTTRTSNVWNAWHNVSQQQSFASVVRTATSSLTAVQSRNGSNWNRFGFNGRQWTRLTSSSSSFSTARLFSHKLNNNNEPGGNAASSWTALAAAMFMAMGLMTNNQWYNNNQQQEEEQKCHTQCCGIAGVVGDLKNHDARYVKKKIFLDNNSVLNNKSKLALIFTLLLSHQSLLLQSYLVNF